MKPTYLNSKNFKKKTSSTQIAQPLKPSTQKFNELKNKINQQKEIMNKTGKRFRQQSAKSNASSSSRNSDSNNKRDINNVNKEIDIGVQIYDKRFDASSMKKKQQSVGQMHAISISTDSPPKDLKIKMNTFQSGSCPMKNSSVSTTQPKQQISLTDLGNVKQCQKINSKYQNSLSSSKVFQKQIQLQKQRGGQLKKFLTQLSLQSFFQKFVQTGYDDIQTAAQIQIEQLNHMMMRAQQQDRFMNAIKKVKLEMGFQDEKNQQKMIPNRSSVISKRHHRPTSAVTTIPSTPSRSRALQKSQKNLNKNNKQQIKFNLSSKSFLYTVGPNQWSVELQIRRACSSCFKVSQNITKKGQCYYCSDCYKFVSQDPLNIALSSSMMRQYHHN